MVLAEIKPKNLSIFPYLYSKIFDREWNSRSLISIFRVDVLMSDVSTWLIVQTNIFIFFLLFTPFTLIYSFYTNMYSFYPSFNQDFSNKHFHFFYYLHCLHFLYSSIILLFYTLNSLCAWYRSSLDFSQNLTWFH